jgi:hypothetical protein
MKRTIKLKAYDGNGTRIEVKFNLTTEHLVREEVETQVASIKDELMEMLPKIRYSKFYLSDARFIK